MSVSIFMFHDVKDPPFQYQKRYIMRSFLRIKTFIERINYIQKNYEVICLKKLVSNELTLLSNKEYAVLTFDDGMKDHYDNVFPILKSRNLPATFFIPVNCVTKQELIHCHKIQYLIASFEDLKVLVEEFFDTLNFFRNSYSLKSKEELWNEFSVSTFNKRANWWSLEEIFITRILREGLTYELRNTIIDIMFEQFVKLKENIYMNMDNVREIYNTPGFTIGGHGLTSYNLKDINIEQCNIEVSESKKFLEELGENCFLFSYPNGGVTSEIEQILKENGFTGAVTTIQEKISSNNCVNNLQLPRFDGSQYTFSPKIVMCGIQEQGIDILYHLREQGIKVTHVITIDEIEATKQKASGWIDYTNKLPNDVEIYHAKNYSFRTKEDYEYFHTQRFDILILGGWQRLISGPILRLIKYGSIGQHGSSEFLPKFRGRSPINWSIILGKKRLIWHLFFMTAGIDDGEIIDFEVFDINDWDTCETVYYKVAIAVKYMLSKNIPKILNGKFETYKQLGEPTFYEKRTPDDGKIDWNSSMYHIYNLIRGVTKPYPGAFTMKGDTKIMIWKAQPFTTGLSFYIEKKYGEIVEVFENSYVVKAEEGLLLITESDDINPNKGDFYC